MFGILCSSLLTISALIPTKDAHADIGATHTALVSEFASFNTPGVVDGRVEAIAIDGDTVFVGGTFTQIQQPLSDEIINQPYLFAYSKSTGNILSEFDPVLNNSVFALETTGEGTGVFAGGIFNSINGESNRRGIVKINDSGDRVPGFGARADALVNSLVRLDNTLYLGGAFESISSTPVEHLAAIDTTSGAVLPEVNLDFDGVLSTEITTGRQGVDDIDITSDGRYMIVVGNFSVIDGVSRPRLALIELDGQARVSNWNTDIFDVQCPGILFPQYIRGIDIAPDNSYVVTGSSGFRTPGLPACDTVVRLEIDDLTNTNVQPTWVNYSGGDSVFEVVATDHAVYAGGHFRWLNNDTTIDGESQGPGSLERRGFAAIDPLNGLTLLDWRADRNPRGVGVFSLIAEDEGLYMGDDTDFFNGTEHQKLKFLPITTDTIARPDAPSLPTTLLNVDVGTIALTGSSFDGSNIGAPEVLRNSGFENVRGAMFIGGRLFHADANGNMWLSQFNGETFESPSPVDLFGQTNNEWEITRITGMFFDYDWSRVYYTLAFDSRLFYRAFTPDGPYFGNDRFVAEQQGDIPWFDVSGMDVINDRLYFARNDGTLYRSEIDGAAVISGTTVAISGPNIDGRQWNNRSLAFTGDGMPVGNTSEAQFEFESNGSQTNGRFRTFEFPVTPGEPVVVSVDWPDANALVNLFVRDANGQTVASDSSPNGSPKFVTAPAGAGGTYTAAVLVREGSTSYTLQVNPISGVPVPEPLIADFDFSSVGSDVPAQGRFQSFSFAVEAGQTVNAQVFWNDTNADVRVFLRDESGSQVDRDSNGNGLAEVSAIAGSSGQWSVAVLVRSGTNVNYEGLVSTN